MNHTLLKKHMNISYQYIEDSNTCDLIYRVRDNCVNYFDEAYTNVINSFALLVKLTSLMLIIFNASVISGLVILLVAIPLLYLAMRTGKENYVLEKDAEAIKRKYQYLFSILTNKEAANERNLFGFSGKLAEKYNQLFDTALEKETKIINKRYANMKSGSVVTLIVSICIMVIMLPGLFRNEMSVGLYIGLAGAVLDLIQSMSWSLAGMMQNFAKINQFFGDYNQFMELNEQEGASDEPNEIPVTNESSLEFRDVSFRYPGTDRYVLKNCSFYLSGGRSYAVVGENGAGKTTIAKLIMGLYSDYEGSIFINGRNIKEYSYCELKGLVGAVFQDFARYELSVRENIEIGNIAQYSRTSDEKEIENICDDLNMSDWIHSFPKGFDTMLGKLEEEGVDLSGGQWQKIAIARMLYRKASINILDEPTAAMDPIAESKIYELFQNINIGKFNIIITHRMGAAKVADEILVLQNGDVIEKGKHDQLMNLENGVYREMYESQRQWYE
jgi:ATP-binding cassette subfamily B protein